jgi:N-acetylglutamate synthase-like GNAT family acetyltransferase
MLLRRARSADAPALTALYQHLVPGDPDIRVDPAQLAELEHDPDNVVIVAELDATVRATAALTICRDVMYGAQPYGVVENVVVDAAHHGRGPGRAVLAEVEAVARTRACTKLMLLSAAARTGAHAFFARCGFDGTAKRGFVNYLNRRA